MVVLNWFGVDFDPFVSPTGTRYSDGDGSSNEVQRTMLELINQLDGFDPRGNIKVLMATNRSSERCNTHNILKSHAAQITQFCLLSVFSWWLCT